ncbi:serine/threonine-protein kinase [Subtercola vilae]|uniref:non-specific serine/threonine protein kinase n=1 Tax=Subtercola vilae TaxID=2056433 RepID=A0A4T2CBM6_9MICO|nr:serine/threonine-protein kinase [Subtercola vilae]TIH40106.1 serine/threonine protein kinase [Subtercola vilae]
MESDENVWVGRVLAGRYTVTSRIGSGGMSTVYQASDQQLGRSVAVKLFNPGEARDDSRRRSEVDVLARLNHPNLVTMHDAHLASGDETTPSFLVMELVNGPDLRSTLDHGPLRGMVAAQIASDIAEGLAAMHALGIVHRDLKPANILLAPTGLPSPTHRAKLADFGIAHLIGADRMTTVGTVIGTAAYLSPEQASGADPGPEADVYALGLVILEGLTGHREYPGTIVESMGARATRDPRVDGSLPASWVSLITQMTARDPAARPSALDVAIRARDISADLAGWEGATAAPSRSDATVAMVSPTLRMPAVPETTEATLPLAGSVAPAIPLSSHRTSGKRRTVIALVAAALLVAGIVWAGGSWLNAPTTDPAGPRPIPSQTDTTIDVPADATSPAPAQPSILPDQTPQTATTASPTPSTTSTASTPAVPAVTPTPATSTNGNGNGNNGNGNGNGKGKGKGNG